MQLQIMTMAGKKAGLLVNWSVTGKRGRKQQEQDQDGLKKHRQAETRTTTVDSASAASQEEEIGVFAEEADMASCLVMLACSNGNAKNGTVVGSLQTCNPNENGTVVGSVQENGAVYETTEEGPEVFEDYSSHVSKAEKMMAMGTESDGSSTIRDSDRKVSECRVRPHAAASASASASAAAAAGTDVDDWSLGSEDSNGGRLFKCDKCNKSFGCHQALGGHRASHRRVKGCFASAAKARIFPGYDFEEDLVSSERNFRQRQQQHNYVNNHHSSSESTTVGISVKRDNNSSKGGHECSVCHKVFLSGQALGGHKRCHWAGNRATSKTNSLSLISQQWTKKKNNDGRKKQQLLLLPDLNQPPPPEAFYDDDDMEAAYSITEV